MPIQDVPIRLPLNYEGFKDWFPRFVREFIVPLDVRNSEGNGITVSSNGNSRATLATQVTQASMEEAIEDSIEDHIAENDPHPTYLNQTEGDALYASLAAFNALAARFRYGSGTPEGSVTAEQGTIYLRSDGANANEVVYVKTSGSGNTGWTAMTVP